MNARVNLSADVGRHRGLNGDRCRFGERVHAVLVTATLIALLSEAAPARTFQILYAFKAGNDGFWPNSNMAMDGSGNLYGATADGGGSVNCRGGCGTLFRLDTGGKETVLYSFTGKADGQYPMGVILDATGNIYGATLWGGNPDCEGNNNSCGVVYKLDRKGRLTVLHTFEGDGDGTNPEAALVMDSSGNLYGTTLAGGAGGGCVTNYPPGCGTVFEISTNGQEMILHAFAGSDGANPSAGLLRDTDGNLYGSTLFGGASGAGTIFKVSKEGKETVLHDFTGGVLDNGYPYDGLAWDGGENLYGTTEGHPLGSNVFGTVFKLDRKTGDFTTLFKFDLTDGGYPISGLLRDAKGNLFGTTLSGGSCQYNQCGTVFEIDKDGRETTLHNFSEGKKGDAPQSIPVRDAAGNLYGTALDGPNGAGIIYRLTR